MRNGVLWREIEERVDTSIARSSTQKPNSSATARNVAGGTVLILGFPSNRRRIRHQTKWHFESYLA